jgi:hypothetical protein
MSEERSRNDLCYCGSNKKYKNCHLKPYYPQSYFVTALHALDTIDVVNNLPPDIIISRSDVTVRDPFPWDNEINDVLKPFESLILDKNYRWQNRIRLRLNKLHHKMDAIKYHTYIFKLVEDKIEREWKTFIVGNHTTNKIIEMPDLVYSTEGFLFQIKSGLDVLAQIILFGFEEEGISTFGDKGKGLIRELENKANRKYPEYVVQIIQIIESNFNWIRNLIEVRDEVAHFSDIEGLSCFMIKKVGVTDLEVTVYYPSMPDGQRVASFMDDTWLKLRKLMYECLLIIANKIRNDISKNNKH